MSDNEGKIRELLPSLDGLIQNLADGAKDIAALEISNSTAASRRARAHIREHRTLVDNFYAILDKARLECVAEDEKRSH
jgi:hypothetical protein